MAADPRSHLRRLRNALLAGGALIALAGCVYAPVPYAAAPGYYAGPAYAYSGYSGYPYGYYAPSVGISVGGWYGHGWGGGWHNGWGGWGGGWHGGGHWH